MTIKILSISSPGGDRGPATMYKNHLLACSETNDFSITNITQEIWESDSLLKQFDVAWAYVRFHPVILQKLRNLNIPVIGGPAIAMESAHDGIVDDYERWYLTQSDVQVNLNVAKYYSDHVATFTKNGMRCEVLEGCYDFSIFNQKTEDSDKKIDVLLYDKVRINDSRVESKNRLDLLRRSLEEREYTTSTLTYGEYDRDQYIELCSKSKVVAWMSIEDYASLAQIEAHLAGACVVGTPYNLTIPVTNEALCHNSQVLQSWISWKDTNIVVNDYVKTIENVLSISNLSSLTRGEAMKRHSFETYRKTLMKIMGKII